MDGTKLNNPNDPLGRTENAARELFKAFGAAANGHGNDTVIDAAANMLVNAIRQSCKNRRGAEAKYDDLVGRLKGVLLSHYDGVNGNRRHIFPFTQNIDVPFNEFRQKF